MMTPEDCLRKAFAALVRGDTAERDRWCDLASNVINARDRVVKSGAVRQVVQGRIIELPDGTLELKV